MSLATNNWDIHSSTLDDNLKKCLPTPFRNYLRAKENPNADLHNRIMGLHQH